MNTRARIFVFGSLSGLLWSVAPGFLADLFSFRTNIPGTLIAAIISGIITSAILGLVVTRFGRGVTAILGLFSLPLGAFVFGFSFALIDRFLPALTSGTRASVDPWTLGSNYAVLSVISVFAIGLFPLAVLTTLVLRTFILRARQHPAS